MLTIMRGLTLISPDYSVQSGSHDNSANSNDDDNKRLHQRLRVNHNHVTLFTAAITPLQTLRSSYASRQNSLYGSSSHDHQSWFNCLLA